MKIAIITNIITSYREGFYDRLFKIKDFDITVYCNDHLKGTKLKSIHKKYADRVQIVHHIGLKNEKIGFQFLPLLKIIKNNDVIFLDGNPRTLSNLLIGFIALFLKNKKIVIWTMAHSFGANKFTENIRLKWTSLYENIFVYTDKEVETLRQKGFKKQNIIGMNNGLDQKKIDNQIDIWNNTKLSHWQKSKNLQGKTVLLSVARLIPKNNFDIMILALPELLEALPNTIWVLVGDGEQRGYLKNLAQKTGVEDSILFTGAIFKEEELAPYFLSSKLFIHPSSIGLSIMHAFGYGIPVIVDNIESMHGPEYGAFVDGATGLNYEQRNSAELALKIKDALSKPELLENMKRTTMKIARKDYNVDIMVERFSNMVNSK